MVGTVREIAYVNNFTFTDAEIKSYVSKLEDVLWPKVHGMYDDTNVEPNIPASLREFGLYIERNSLVQRIHL